MREGRREIVREREREREREKQREKELPEEHKDVIAEDHIIGNAGKDPANEPPRSEESHRHQPAFESSLLLKS